MGCPGNCASDCPGNMVCTGHQPHCPTNGKNGTGWNDPVLVAGVTFIKASHLNELELAINAERVHATRRGAGTQTACPSNTPGAYGFSGARGVGNIIDADHFTAVSKAVNSTPYNVNGVYPGTPQPYTPDPYVNDGGFQPVETVHIYILRMAINDIEDNCICHAYTIFNCGCDGECVGNNPY